MTKYLSFFLVAGWLLAWVPARAQAQVVVPSVGDSLAEAAREDTAVALQRLFLAQRRYSRTKLILGALMTGSGSLLLAVNRPETTYQRVSTVGFGVAVGYYTYQFVDNLVLLRRFRSKREEQVLADLENGQPLPRWVRKKLKPSYFSVPITTH